MPRKYNAFGYPEKIISPLGGVRTICYNDFNLPISSQDENNIVTTYRYNEAGLIDQVTQTHEGTTLSYPLGYPDGWNALAYCNNGVTSAVDLWGCVKLLVREENVRDKVISEWVYAFDPELQKSCWWRWHSKEWDQIYCEIGSGDNDASILDCVSLGLTVTGAVVGIAGLTITAPVVTIAGAVLGVNVISDIYETYAKRENDLKEYQFNKLEEFSEYRFKTYREFE